MQTKTILIAILAVLSVVLAGVLGYQKLTQPELSSALPVTTPIVANQPATNQAQDETAGWKTYRNDRIGVQFKYPGNGEVENTDYIDKEIGPIDVKAFSIGDWGPYGIIDNWGTYDPNPEGVDEIVKQKNEKYYKDLFLSIKDFSQNQECNNLDIMLPIFGESNLGESCKIVNSDSGVKIITGFYKNIHGEPPKVAFFVTDKYSIELLLYYYDYNRELIISNLNSDNFIQDIHLNKYKDITKKIDIFNQILKTVEIIK